MAHQTVFRRYETKYLLTEAQYRLICRAMAEHMEPDRYGHTTVRNIYFDTENYRLIRRSIEKPLYKEKLRIRSYAGPDGDGAVFVELKKKFEGVVYKRRVKMDTQAAMDWLCLGQFQGTDSQIVREIDYFRQYYAPLRPAVFLSYEREAYRAKNGSDFRLTFDREAYSCWEAGSGEQADLLPEGMLLMELKTAGGIPLWLTRILTQEKIYKASFSKYGTAYQKLIYEVIYHGNTV